MRIFLSLIFSFLLCSFSLEAHMSHCYSPIKKWREENLPPFDELILSWNAPRPIHGRYSFYVRVQTEGKWSPRLLYATWGSDGQLSFRDTAFDGIVRQYQDTLSLREGHKATGFQVEVVPVGKDASLENIYGLHVYTNGDRKAELLPPVLPKLPILLDVKGKSKMQLPHERFAHLGSPILTATVVRFLSKDDRIDFVDFAQNVWDRGFSIYGNWVFSIAQASVKLGPKWSAWVERANSFEEIYRRLQQGTPVVVSVQGPLPGSNLSKNRGGLLAIVGYNPAAEKLWCIDSTFQNDEETIVSYELNDFLRAWDRRGRIAYIFQKQAELDK